MKHSSVNCILHKDVWLYLQRDLIDPGGGIGITKRVLVIQTHPSSSHRHPLIQTHPWTLLLYSVTLCVSEWASEGID